jgi:hypothetical protein
LEWTFFEKGPIPVPSISEIARSIQANAREVAAKVKHLNQKYRHTRDQAALIVSEAIGVPFSKETLRKTSCPYINVHGHAMYADDDLIEVASGILSRARKCAQNPKPRKPGHVPTKNQPQACEGLGPIPWKPP